jgi:hypothetical protein
LLADGDSMGKAIDEIGKNEGAAGHRAIGNALDGFSLRCRGIVEHHEGNLIYAGGDDVLALLPLHTALECAAALHDAFGQAFEKLEGLETRPTLSVGLGIAHHMDDMGHARELAKRAEKLAKGHPGKDALGIVLDKRSGSTLELVGSWRQPADGGLLPLDRRLRQWSEWLHSGALSSKAAFDLEQAVAPLLAPDHTHGGSAGSEAPGLDEVAESLAHGVLLRKRQGGGGKDIEAKVRETLAAFFSLTPRPSSPSAASAAPAAASPSPAVASAPRDLARTIERLSHELQAAREFVRAYRVSGKLADDTARSSSSMQQEASL